MNAPFDDTGIYRVGDLIVDGGSHRVMRDSVQLHLTRRSFDLFWVLIHSAPNLVSNEQFMADVWADRVVGHETITQRVKLVRDALGDDPQSPRYIELAWGEGYRLIADVEKVSDTRDRRSTDNIRRRIGVSTVLAASVALVFTFLQLSLDVPARYEGNFMPPRSSLAVMPFMNAGDNQANEFLSRGIPDTLLHSLANLGDVLVISRTSSFALSETGKDSRQIGQDLNVRYLLEGSIQQFENQVRIVAQLIDTTDASHVWSLEKRLPLDNLFDVQDEIVFHISKALQITLQEDEYRKLREYGTKSVPAFLAYLRGEHALRTLSVQGLSHALDHYKEAVRLDPEFARAWLGIAKYYLRLRDFALLDDLEVRSAVRRYVDRSLQFDSKLGEAYAVSAEALLLNPDLSENERLTARRRLLEEAIRYSPSDAAVLQQYASAICTSMERDRACQQRKAAVLREAIRRDPQNAAGYIDLAWTLVALNQQEGPAQLFMESVRRNPDFIPGYTSLALWYWGMDEIDWERSVICLCEALERDPKNIVPLSMLANIHIDLGLAFAAEEFGRKADELNRVRQSVFQYSQLKLALFRGERHEAAEIARRHLDTLAQGSLAIITLGAIVESALARGDYSNDLKILEAQFTRANQQIEYKSGVVRSRSAAYTAVALSTLHRAAGNFQRAERLIAGARQYFEREIANQSIWRPVNAWAYAATLVHGGQFTAALRELETVPTRYLRNSWYVTRLPYFDSIKAHEQFRKIGGDIDREISRQRAEVSALDADDLPPCLDNASYQLPGLLALGLPSEEQTPEVAWLAAIR